MPRTTPALRQRRRWPALPRGDPLGAQSGSQGVCRTRPPIRQKQGRRDRTLGASRCKHRNDPSRQTPIAGIIGQRGAAPQQSLRKRPLTIALLGPSSPRARSCWGHRGRPIGRCASRRGDRFPRERSPHLGSRGDRNRREPVTRRRPDRRSLLPAERRRRAPSLWRRSTTPTPDWSAFQLTIASAPRASAPIAVSRAAAELCRVAAMRRQSWGAVGLRLARSRARTRSCGASASPIARYSARSPPICSSSFQQRVPLREGRSQAAAGSLKQRVGRT